MQEQRPPRRKNKRLQGFDYSNMGAYFITICTEGRQPILWNNLVGAISDRPCKELSPYGEIVEQAIGSIALSYPMIVVERYAILPDHIHLLVRIVDMDGRSLIAPTISTVVRQLKSSISKKCGMPIWQKGFYDHIIRNQKDYEEITIYIANNPEKWRQKHM